MNKRLILPIALVFSHASLASVLAADCSGVPGTWNWSINAVVTFQADHAVLVNGTPSGRWVCTNPRTDVVTVNWSNGFVDTMTFTGDRVSAQNQLGIQTTGTRMSGSAAAPSSPVAGSPAGPGSPSAPAVAVGGPVPVVRASGALQQCLGIVPGRPLVVGSTAAKAAACGQLPAADLYEQAGVRFKSGDHAGAARILLGAAQAGNAQAQFRLAVMYAQGDGVARDFKTATAWYARAAAQGDPESQTELGYSYEDGQEIAENWDLAFRLWEASASQGWMKGEFALGRAYEFGIGVPQNRGQAIAWLQKAGVHGNAQGTYYAKWLSDSSNNIGFRSDAEHDLVIAGRLRFALGSADPAGSRSTTHASASIGYGVLALRSTPARR